ncbi:MAG TPA: hypothetical protein VIJ72_04360 [Rhizomicrobium sp.]
MVLGLIGAALVFFGVGLLGYAIAVALAPVLGAAGGAAVAGAIFVLPPFLWAILAAAFRAPRKKPAPAGSAELLTAVIAGLAKEVPWIAILGAGIVGASEMIFKRKKKD